nr:hypothetical protein [Flavobacterium sp. CSZ]
MEITERITKDALARKVGNENRSLTSPLPSMTATNPKEALITSRLQLLSTAPTG